MTTQKLQTSIYLNYDLRERLRRISNILCKTETSIVEEALQYYFSHSKITSDAQRKIRENSRFLQREITIFISRGYEYHKEDDL